jgi:NAD(P)-dependent dehydrogenase (short-subunit alcohol dehydrogenase family)
MDTKLYGAIRVLKGCLPTMRAQKSGTVVTMSSVYGFVACPGILAYNAANAALEALGETLAMELASSNIRSIIVEPGLFRTNVMASATRPKAAVGSDYVDTTVSQIDGLAKHIAANPEDTMPGDPKKLAQRLVEVVDGTGMAEALKKTFLRLPLGQDGLVDMHRKLKDVKENFDAMEEIANSTDFEGTSAAGLGMVDDVSGKR